MGTELNRRWESGTLAHGVSDPFGQGPLPWLRSPDQYLADGGVPWYVSVDAPGQQPLGVGARHRAADRGIRAVEAAERGVHAGSSAKRGAVSPAARHLATVSMASTIAS